MAIIRSVPRNRRMPALRNAVMVDTVRGVLRVRKWPKKRGTPKSALQRWWIDWFRQANLLAKYADGMAMARAIEMTRQTGLYPRDVMLSAMRGRLYVWADETGWKWYPMAAVQDISDSLDVLAQTIGSVLVRATDRWRAPPVGVVGDVLTNQGVGAPPVWQAPAAGGYFSGGALVNKTGNQSIASGSFVLLTWDAEQYDTDGIHDNVVNNSRLYVPAGWSKVQLTASIGLSNHATGERAFAFFKNGAQVIGTPWPHAAPVANLNVWLSGGTAVLDVVGGTDYFDLRYYQDSGSNRSVLAGTQTWFFMQRAA